MINLIAIHGYLGHDPEFRTFINDRGEQSLIAKFSVGVSRDFGDGTDWFDVTAFGKRAEVIGKYYHKGSQILLVGRVKTESYTDKNGVQRKGWTVVLEKFDFCDPKKQDTDLPYSFEADESDIPF